MSDEELPPRRITLIDELVARGATFTPGAADHLAEWFVEIVEHVQQLEKQVRVETEKCASLERLHDAFEARLRQIEARLPRD